MLALWIYYWFTVDLFVDLYIYMGLNGFRLFVVWKWVCINEYGGAAEYKHMERIICMDLWDLIIHVFPVLFHIGILFRRNNGVEPTEIEV
jgi:hypothetical protein